MELFVGKLGVSSRTGNAIAVPTNRTPVALHPECVGNFLFDNHRHAIEPTLDALFEDPDYGELLVDMVTAGLPENLCARCQEELDGDD